MILVAIASNLSFCSSKENAPRISKVKNSESDKCEDIEDESEENKNFSNCREDNEEIDLLKKSESDTPVMTELEVQEFLIEKCSSCHGIDDNGKQAPNFASWPLTPTTLSQRELETSIFAPMVYAAIHNKISSDPVTTPSPMPPGELNKGESEKLRGVFGWFSVNLPLVVAEAEQTYGIKSSGSETEAILQFTCTNPVTTRIFLNRITYAAFDRPPKDSEIDLFDKDDLDKPITNRLRKTIVDELKTERWKGEFQAVGLKKLAQMIAGSAGVKPSLKLSDPLASVLKLELYLSMLKNFDTFDYGQFFSNNEVRVSLLTAPFYGCQGKPNDYEDCELKPPRSGYFSTMGFLASKPSNFLIENNNYGRVSAMYFTLYGEGFSAAFDGPSGGKIKELPSCLETVDTRMRNEAPRGAAAIPAFGNFCQSCHISRNMAAGSILFRPFSYIGDVYTPNNLDTVDPEHFEESVLEEWTYVAKPGDQPDTGTAVDKTFLLSLLENAPKACAVSPNDSSKTTKFKSISDLADFLMTNERALVRGFIRHAHRAFSSSQNVNFDLVYRGIKSFEDGKKKLPDLIDSYFKSETFACESRD